ncbi:unnamed protein product [Mytilus coruscus]|uniref:Uncharacterized protein n=1 Tax=Mytilus coruscus TaxID=42192 RepID=A0A6J8CAV5_MYTCO|nr:unnamed protein product [Mytilus coruscus]
MRLYQGFLLEELLKDLFELLQHLFAALKSILKDTDESTHFPDINPEIAAMELGGKEMLAIDVFSMSIKGLVEDFMNHLRKTGVDFLSISDIKWVLTVPAIWGERAKQFMRKSAVKAGIPDENLLIALEPECASVYCQYLRSEQMLGAENGFKPSEKGCSYMVVDIGGGTVDIAVHEKLQGQHLKELCRATGGDCGGTSVDNVFIEMLKQLFGDKITSEFKNNDPESYLLLIRSFEVVKRTIKPSTTGKINIQIPYVPLSEFCRLNHNKSMEDLVSSSALRSNVSIYKGHMRIEAEYFRGLFVPTLKTLNSVISKTFQDERITKVDTIVLVGGFSECALVQDSIKSAFPSKRVIVPEECGLAVLKGAVMYGHKPSYISTRIIPFTFGIRVAKPYDGALGHDRDHIFVHNGKEYSKDLFHVILECDSEVHVDTKIIKEFSTRRPLQNFIRIRMYMTKRKDPVYIDEEHCSFIGKAVIRITHPTKALKKVRVVFKFGNTEINVEAEDEDKDDKYEGLIDFLANDNEPEPDDGDLEIDIGTPDILLDEW